ncbi:glycosyl transferase family A [candidate division KSB3 bacterium]|uniref:Glycosyl transferase family A n=1 Tax=candidate division KSB3 bacterium TaxID=2044937 RepID=A0A2G6E7Z3_9BACT|nr:MAG: glycosyl transferase family A [candidate division KSB3 bacterium]PIE30401.1 MAG: glycosyl transferase family A [candidate division KSB3 bacterium]
MRISCIIPHKGREELLTLTIQSVLAQEWDLSNIEIIVVTQNRELTCPYVPQERLGAFRILFRPEHETISTLRNTGVEHASGDFLAFLDADIQLAPDWIEVMLREIQRQPERVLVSAAQKKSPDGGRLETIRVLLSNAELDCPVQFLPGRNLLLARSTFDKVGGFPEHLVTCEDYYFTDAVHQYGELYYSSKSWYIHLGEDQEYGEMFRKEIWRAQSNVQSLQGRRIPLREYPSLLVPFWQTLFLLVMIFSALGGSFRVALISALAAVLPACLYAARLYIKGRDQITLFDALKFYAVYFPARILGTLGGLFRKIAG